MSACLLSSAHCERRNRDQPTALVNLHVAAVTTGAVLSVTTVLSQLEREPGETVVDPWVSERRCLVAERDHGVVAAALLHRFGADAGVGENYRGAGEVRWVITDGQALLEPAMDQLRRWGVTTVGGGCALPAPGCHGVPDTLPHLRSLLTGEGFGEPTRREGRARGDLRLPAARSPRRSRRHSRGRHPWFSVHRVRRQRHPWPHRGVPASADFARSSFAAYWADIGNSTK